LESFESFWNDKRVMVTGGAGFLGAHITEIYIIENYICTA
jgi:nucleoside-diphosphate-sugar epimerase